MRAAPGPAAGAAAPGPAAGAVLVAGVAGALQSAGCGPATSCVATEVSRDGAGGIPLSGGTRRWPTALRASPGCTVHVGAIVVRRPA